MPEERQLPQQKLVKASFEGDSELPVHYVNIVNVRAGVDEVFITLGTVIPPEITDIRDLESLDTIKAHPLFRFAMSKNVMKQMIDLMQNIYNHQLSQTEMMDTSQSED
ncbi:MAG: hypothetical protein JO202_01780 [Ktedonobacteraceae bacterium]|nr:hypothetical protein [Ktedonobacteraceae bacterium]